MWNFDQSDSCTSASFFLLTIFHLVNGRCSKEEMRVVVMRSLIFESQRVRRNEDVQLHVLPAVVEEELRVFETLHYLHIGRKC